MIEQRELSRDTHQLRRIAAEAVCDPETVRRFLTGASTRSTSRTRITAALENLGIILKPEASGRENEHA